VYFILFRIFLAIFLYGCWQITLKHNIISIFLAPILEGRKKKNRYTKTKQSCRSPSPIFLSSLRALRSPVSKYFQESYTSVLCMRIFTNIRHKARFLWQSFSCRLYRPLSCLHESTGISNNEVARKRARL
jgi:hypothetical protein